MSQQQRRKGEASAPSTPTRAKAAAAAAAASTPRATMSTVKRTTPSSLSSTSPNSSLGPITPPTQQDAASTWREFGGVPPAPKAPTRHFALEAQRRRRRSARRNPGSLKGKEEEEEDDSEGSPTPTYSAVPRRLTYGRELGNNAVQGEGSAQTTTKDVEVVAQQPSSSSQGEPARWLLPAFTQRKYVNKRSSSKDSWEEESGPSSSMYAPGFQGGGRIWDRGSKRRRVTANEAREPMLKLSLANDVDHRRSMRRKLSEQAEASQPSMGGITIPPTASIMARSQSASLLQNSNLQPQSQGSTAQCCRPRSSTMLCARRSLFAAASPRSAPLSPLVSSRNSRTSKRRRPSKSPSSSAASPRIVTDACRDYFGPGPWWAATSPGTVSSSPRVC